MNWWFEWKTNQNHFSFCSIKNDLNTPCLLLATVWLIHQFSTPLLYRYQNAIKFRDFICCCPYHILHFNFENIVKGRYFLFWLKTSLFFIKNDWLEDDSKFLFVFHLAKMGVERNERRQFEFHCKNKIIERAWAV